MFLKSEIKDFIKKVLLLWILLSVFINLVFVYVYWFDKLETSAGNEYKFKKLWDSYIWISWVALSFNIGTKLQDKSNIPVNLTQEALPISELIWDKWTWRKKFISSNMVAINEYLNVLKTDVNNLLDSSSDRESTLSSFIEQLEYRYKNTQERLQNLQSQANELQWVINSSNSSLKSLKNDLVSAYKNLDYDRTEENFATYIDEKEKNTYASVYLVFVWRFANSYSVLNQYNKQLLDTLINNKEALIKNVTITFPDTWTSFMKDLNLIQTEKEAKN